MPHPSLEEILSGTTDAAEHVAGCDTCRALAALAAVPASGTDAFPSELVERERYVEWKALGAGGGGMGRTFLARDRRLGREVVIKQPLDGLDLNARFEREALLTARLQHPAIVSVYEAGRFPDGDPFYAMPLVRGAPLSDEIARRPTLEERLALLQNVTTACEAIAYAHEQGIVHRDVKPANILVGSFGETVVIDWGLAVDVRGESSAHVAADTEVKDGLTQLGIGTPHYMPPEQAIGSKPDPRMDVYALGATLYHTLAGRPPFASMDSREARRVLLEDAAPSLAAVAPEVPAPLVDIVMRAMSRDPANRFETASALAAELRRFQTGQLVQSRRYTPAEILRHFARRYRSQLVVGGVAAMVLAAGAVAATVRIAKARHAASAAQARAEANERTSQQELRRGLGVSASRLALSPTRRLDALALAVDAVAPDLPSPAHDALQGLYDANGAGAAAVALDITTEVERFAFSADGALLATLAPGEHAVHIWDGRTGKAIGSAATGGAHFSVRDMRFSPDGAWLLTWSDEPAQAQLWPVRTGRAITLPLDGTLAGADFLPDGTIVIAGTGVAFLRGDGTEVRRVPLSAPATSLAIGGGRVAVITASGDVRVLDAAGGSIASLRVPSGTKVALSRDGSRVAVLSATALEVLDVSAGTAQSRVALAAAPDARAELSFAAGDRFVAITDRVRGSTVIDTRTATGRTAGRGPVASPWTGSPAHLARLDLAALRPVQTIDGPPGLALFALAVAGDGRVAAATERASWLVDGRAEAAGYLPGHTSEVTAVVSSGTSTITAGLDGRIAVWDSDGRATDATSIDAEVLALTAAGSTLVVGAADGTVSAYAITSGRLGARAQLALAGAPVAALAISPDARYVIISRNDGELFAIALAGDHAPARWQPPGSPVATTIVIDGDGSVATGHLDGTVRLWRVATPALATSAPTATVIAQATVQDRDNAGRARFTLAFDAAGRLLASRFGGDTLAYAAHTFATGSTLEGRIVAVARDRSIATTTAKGDLLVFHDVTRPATRIAMSARPIVSATFTPDGTALVTGDVDGVIHVIDIARAASGATDVVLQIPSGTSAVTTLVTDGTIVVAGHASGALRSHAIAPTAALRRACRTLAHFHRDASGCAEMGPDPISRLSRE